MPQRLVAAGLDKLSLWAAQVAAWLLAALTLLTVFLVLSRRLTGYAPIALDELRWHCFGAAFLLGMAWTLRRDGHVRVDVVAARLPQRWRARIEAASLLAIALPACLLIAGYGGWMAWGSLAEWESSPEPGGLPLRGIIKGCIPLGFCLLALQALAGGLRSLQAPAAGPTDPPPVKEPAV